MSEQTHRSRRLQAHFFYLTHINWFTQSYRHQEFTQFKIKESKIRVHSTRVQQSLPQGTRSLSVLHSVTTTEPSQTSPPLRRATKSIRHHPSISIPPSRPYLLPLAVGGEFLGRNEEAESEDGFEFGRQPLGLKVLKLRLPLPQHRHVQTEAEHLSEPKTQLPRSLRPARKGSKTERFPRANFSSWWRGNASTSHDTCL